MMYLCFIHPNWSFDETPKQRWKREQSWKRWERRYGKPRELLRGELGTYQGIRFIKSEH